MSHTLTSRAKPCLLAISIATCLYGNSYGQETFFSSLLAEQQKPTPSLDFKELDPSENGSGAEDLENGTPVYTSDPQLNLSYLADVWNDPENTNPLNFAFIQKENGGHAFELWNISTNQLTDKPYEINRALNVWMDSNLNASSSTAFLLRPVDGKPTTLLFNKALNLNYEASGNKSVAIMIGKGFTKDEDGADIYVTFNDLKIKGQFVGTNNVLLYLGPRATVDLYGETVLIGEGENPVVGVYLSSIPDAIDSSVSALNIHNNFLLSADYVLEGSGVVTVDYSDSVSPHWSALYGSLENFHGDWNQTGGYLYVDGKMDASQKWNLSNVWLVTGSENAFETSMENWSPDQSALQATFKSGALSGLVLTDSRISFDYLARAAQAYGKGTELIVTGEIYTIDKAITEVSLESLSKLYSNEKFSNVSFANLALNLSDTSSLEQKTISIGEIRGNNSELTLQNTSLTLYGSSSDSAVTNITELNIEENSTLTLHGNYGETGHTNYQVTLESTKVNISDQGTMDLYGRVDIKNTTITNNGFLNFQAGSNVNFNADLDQVDGITEIKNDSEVNFTGNVQINGGDFITQGTLRASSFIQTAGISEFNGLTYITNFNLSGSSKSALPIAYVGTGTKFYAANLSLNSAHLVLGDGNRDSGRAFLLTDNLRIENNASLTVSGNGVLIYGKHEEIDKDELSFDTEIKGGYLTTTNIIEHLSQHGADQNAVLAVNSSIDVSAIHGLTIGETSPVATLALSEDSKSADISLTKGSVLIINPALTDPAFTSSTGEPVTLSLEDDSTLVVLDAFNLKSLTDGNVNLLDDYIGSNIISGSPYVDVELVKTDDGWEFARTVDLEAASQDFIYPHIQNYLYTGYEDFNISSTNPGVQFFAKADNQFYTLQSIKNKIIAQTTLPSWMLGAKFTALNSTEKALNYMSNELRDGFGMKAGDYSLYGGISYDFLLSKPMYSYLGGTSFRSNIETFDIGLIYAWDDSVRFGASFAAAKVDTNARHSIVSASNRQGNFFFGLGVEKNIGPFTFGAFAGYTYSDNKIKGYVPASMQMGKLTSKLPTHYVSVGFDLAVKPTSWFSLSFKPTLYTLPSTKETIKFGGKDAFSSKSSTQSIVAFPLSADFNASIGKVGNADLKAVGKIQGVLKTGQLKEKTKFRVLGVSEIENLQLSNLSKWDAGLQVGLSANTKNTKTAFNVGVQTGGRTKVGATAMLQLRAKF